MRAEKLGIDPGLEYPVDEPRKVSRPDFRLDRSHPDGVPRWVWTVVLEGDPYGELDPNDLDRFERLTASERNENDWYVLTDNHAF